MNVYAPCNCRLKKKLSGGLLGVRFAARYNYISKQMCLFSILKSADFFYLLSKATHSLWDFYQPEYFQEESKGWNEPYFNVTITWNVSVMEISGWKFCFRGMCWNIPPAAILILLHYDSDILSSFFGKCLNSGWLVQTIMLLHCLPAHFSLTSLGIFISVAVPFGHGPCWLNFVFVLSPPFLQRACLRCTTLAHVGSTTPWCWSF